jgi:hypothetical protein
MLALTMLGWDAFMVVRSLVVLGRIVKRVPLASQPQMESSADYIETLSDSLE